MTSLGTVMIIDDEDIDQRQYKRILDRSGMTREVLQFHYADVALDWLTENPDYPVDLIFLDINMPRMNGFEFLEERAQRKDWRTVPIIILLSTSIDPRDQARASAFADVSGLFSKPLRARHLEEAAHIVSARG